MNHLFLTMGGTPTKMADKDRFIKKKFEEWSKSHGGRDPNPIEREKLVQQFTEEFFSGSIDSPGIEQLERNIKIRF